MSYLIGTSIQLPVSQLPVFAHDSSSLRRDVYLRREPLMNTRMRYFLSLSRIPFDQ